MNIPVNKPVKIVMIGAGGTGGHAAPNIYRLLHSIDRSAKFIIADGDVVESKNLVRQNFISADLGKNKAKVMAERYSAAFGMETEYIPEFIENEEQLLDVLSSDSVQQNQYGYKYPKRCQVILIGAVDNNKSRQLCHKCFYKMNNIIYIDSGNGEHTGQVVCGVRRSGKTIMKPVGRVYPDILRKNADDKFPTELSCAEASISSPQSITANITAAAAIVNYVYNIVVLGTIESHYVTFSTQNIHVRPTAKKTIKRKMKGVA